MNFQASELNKKISKTIDSLLKDYKDNTEKLMGLNFLKEINTKESKIKKYLSIDSWFLFYVIYYWSLWLFLCYNDAFRNLIDFL